MSEKKLVMAIPSKGRLFDESAQLMQDAGISFEFEKRKLVTTANIASEDRQFTLALMRPKDIRNLVVARKVDLGITGSDTLEEAPPTAWDNRIQTLLRLGIGRCNLVLAAPESQGFFSAEELKKQGEEWWQFPAEYRCILQFDGKVLATSYPRIYRDYVNYWESFLNNNRVGEALSIKSEFIELAGSVEAAPALGIADGIVDLVETGNSLKANDLKPLLDVASFEACLITNSGNKKGDNPTLDLVRDQMFKVLLERNNPDAIARKKGLEQLQRQVALFR